MTMRCGAESGSGRTLVVVVVVLRDVVPVVGSDEGLAAVLADMLLVSLGAVRVDTVPRDPRGRCRRTGTPEGQDEGDPERRPRPGGDPGHARDAARRPTA
ncbi:hypothetical protein GCM10025862_20580 [Arsenicicoccus piscis]|uniref:Uncharacterized protein n=1 Tax=Arsenicicoccus piscis TaxID=673954 RepID=A0ABQ6HNX3_9MICO|nr:hypothetical protein GCM10025862_20580 [Arsenicicoccus piscis]